MAMNFPVTESQKKALNFSPKDYQCLLENDVETIVNLTDVIIYLVLSNGYGIWYYVENVRDNILHGHKMSGDKWVYMPIELHKIRTYY